MTQRKINKITALTSVYNAMPYLPKTVASILAQTFCDFEYLIINDGSDDGSTEYLKSLTDPRVRVVNADHAGQAMALNLGLREARHEWIAHIDADDIALPQRLARQIDFLEKNPEYSLVSCGNGYLGASGKRLRAEQSPRLLHPPRYDPNTDSLILHQGLFYERQAVLAVGGYRNIPSGNDLDLYFRLSERFKLASLDEILMLVRILPTGITSDGFVAQRIHWDYAAACARARREGKAEPELEAFRKENWPHGRKRWYIEAQRRFRLGGAAWADNKYLRAVWHLGLATLIHPGMVRQKLSNYKKRRRGESV
ncbi:MAG: glycosyltransferase family 2 protein [Planctomycetes bacterium]|nr:glycosyltransferase family 2 protein [Planctomycetota bacterium]